MKNVFDMRTTKFASDIHFGHKTVLEHSYRNFPSTDSMDDYIIARWNRVVAKNDSVILAGDVSLHKDHKRTEEILGELHGDIHLVPGNHDHSWLRRLDRWASVEQIKMINLRWDVNKKFEQDVRVVICHYPMDVWPGIQDGVIHLHGHCHGNLRDKYRNRIDIGIDCQDLEPMTFGQIINRHVGFPRKPVIDHHEYREE